MKNSKLLFLTLILAFLLFNHDMFAQSGFGDLGGIGFDDDVQDEVPIFGHLFLLLSAAVGSFIGYLKFYKK